MPGKCRYQILIRVCGRLNVGEEGSGELHNAIEALVKGADKLVFSSGVNNFSNSRYLFFYT
jgi:hypothetical protein